MNFNKIAYWYIEKNKDDADKLTKITFKTYNCIYKNQGIMFRYRKRYFITVTANGITHIIRAGKILYTDIQKIVFLHKIKEEDFLALIHQVFYFEISESMWRSRNQVLYK